VRALAWGAACAWAALWWAVLFAVALPWRHLGGLVDERLRWLERVVLLSSLWLGFCAARWGAPAQADGAANTRLGLRLLFYPPAILSAVGIVTLRLMGAVDAVGIPLTALAAWGAGVWVGRGDLVRQRCEKLLGGWPRG
jgi:hypothetical protein